MGGRQVIFFIRHAHGEHNAVMEDALKAYYKAHPVRLRHTTAVPTVTTTAGLHDGAGPGLAGAVCLLLARCPLSTGYCPLATDWSPSWVTLPVCTATPALGCLTRWPRLLTGSVALTAGSRSQDKEAPGYTEGYCT
jgi:hypothetical protein